MEEAIKYLVYRNGDYCEFVAPSSVTKPTSGLSTGLWIETNTGNVSFYDKENGWTFQFSLKD